MIGRQLSELARVLDLAPPVQDVRIEAIETDSRKAAEGTLFAALPGTRVDGHDFAADAVERGAVALLLQQPLELASPRPVPQLVVDDVLLALGSIAAYIRQQLNPVVAGITGSNGKTTVKEMLASILRQRHEVLATKGNFNNELGVPLTLFGLEARHRFAVLEMGASKAGDIAYLAKIAQPDVGVITNVGPAHLEGFGSEEGVARAKGEMYASLPPGGCAVINGQQPWSDIWHGMNTAGRTLTFGINERFDISASRAGSDAHLETPEGSFTARLSLPGDHNLANAAAATAAAIALQIPIPDIQAGLENVLPVPGRLYQINTAAGWTVIDDTYNANPASLYSALQVLAGMDGTAWLVLGDMKELGENSRKLHAEVGDAARSLGVNRLFATGELAAHTVDAFGQGAQHFASRSELLRALESELHAGVICLVKGSRSMGMEHIVHAITDPNNKKEAC